MATASMRRRRKLNAPPLQMLIWPQRFLGLARESGRFSSQDRSGEIVRTVARLAGRNLRNGHVEASKRAVKAARIDAIAAAVIGCAQITRLIGRPEVADGPDVPAWVDVDRAAAVPVVRIHARGATIQGERVSRQLVNGRVVETDQTTGAQRMFSMDALREAAKAARDALISAGIALSAFGEVRATRQGGVVVIGLRRVSTLGLGPVIVGA